MKAKDYELKLKMYLERPELTHRMRLKAAWEKYAKLKGLNCEEIPRSFKNLAIVNDWSLLWIPPKKTREDILGAINGNFASILSGQTHLESVSIGIKLELGAMILAELGQYGQAVDDEGQPLKGKKLEKSKDAVIKRVDAIASVIKKLQMEKTFYERSTALFESGG